MNFQKIIETTESHYSDKVIRYGACHMGVDWGSKEGQEIRFEQLLKNISVTEASSILDFGCGYGGLVDYLDRMEFKGQYCGYDISYPMVEKARKLYASLGVRYRFTNEIDKLNPMKYVISSGIFNVKLETKDEEWLPYILHTLKQIEKLSTDGFVFNALSSKTPYEYRENTLYYADPQFISEYCEKTFCAKAILFEDYPLPDFTVYVDLKHRVRN